MSKSALLFVTGTARSGTTLLVQMLNAHPSVAIAVDPYLPLLRSFRDALIRPNFEASLAKRFTSGPLQDYYFTDERLAVMDAIQAGTLATAFDVRERDDLLSAIAARASLESADLVPLLAGLGGSTYRELFDQALAIVAEARSAQRARWVGIKEVWTVEFCNALAQAYPEAKFVVIMRDPRAVVASMRNLAAKDPTQRAHALSYARHWRKFVAFCEHYGRAARFRERLLVIRYEDLVAKSEAMLGRLCDFLDIVPVAAMTDAGGYRNEVGRTAWTHNSSYETARQGIDGTLAGRWRAAVEPSVAHMVELVCGPEMHWLGYRTDQEAAARDPQVLEFLKQDAEAECSWRSDLGDPAQDYQMELDRRLLLSGIWAANDRALVRRHFLFEDMFDVLRAQATGTPDFEMGLRT